MDVILGIYWYMFCYPHMSQNYLENCFDDEKLTQTASFAINSNLFNEISFDKLVGEFAYVESRKVRLINSF